MSGRQRNEAINRSKKMNGVGEEWDKAEQKEAEKKSKYNVWKWIEVMEKKQK